MNIKTKTVLEHIAYSAEYDIHDYYDFYNEETGWNEFQELEEKMKADNPNVVIPEIPNDYNYIEQSVDEFNKEVMHVKYYDMTLQKGIDGEDYHFLIVPETKVAEMGHNGSFRTIKSTYDILLTWISDNGYTVTGKGRSVSIHGPWDRKCRDDYYTIVQIPIK